MSSKANAKIAPKTNKSNNKIATTTNNNNNATTASHNPTVVFEVKVEKQLLEKILSTNQNLNRALQIDKTSKELEHLRFENKRLLEENLDLKSEIQNYVLEERKEQERRKSEHLEMNQSKLLLMRLEKLEHDKKSVYDELKTVSENTGKLQKDNVKLKKDASNMHAFKMELRHLKLALMKEKAANKKLEDEKLELQLTVRDLYEKYKKLDVEKKESQLCLLKMKLKTIEDQKQEIICEVERQKQIVQELCEKKKKEQVKSCCNL